MNKTYLILFFSIVFNTAYAQYKPVEHDSIKIYEHEILKLNRKYQDSLHQNAQYKTLTKRLATLKAYSDNYSAFVIYSTVYTADFSKFNLQNTANHFSSITSPLFGLGYGFSSKKNRRLFDFNITAFGLNKTSSNGNEKIKTSLNTYFQLEWGYDFIKSNVLNIYPYAGFGLRSTMLKYDSQVYTNSSFSSVTDIIQNNKSFNVSTTELSYQAGIGIEAVLSKNSNPGGIIFFIKGGTNGAFKKRSFNIEGVNYDPGFKYGELTGILGFKFFGR